MSSRLASAARCSVAVRMPASTWSPISFARRALAYAEATSGFGYAEVARGLRRGASPISASWPATPASAGAAPAAPFARARSASASAISVATPVAGLVELGGEALDGVEEAVRLAEGVLSRPGRGRDARAVVRGGGLLALGHGGPRGATRARASSRFGATACQEASAYARTRVIAASAAGRRASTASAAAGSPARIAGASLLERAQLLEPVGLGVEPALGLRGSGRSARRASAGAPAGPRASSRRAAGGSRRRPGGRPSPRRSRRGTGRRRPRRTGPRRSRAPARGRGSRRRSRAGAGWPPR